ncbi:hypothetical protein GSI_02332 [Ganoderma sinense ZZ0214-1]|uniref:Glycosyl hydrolase family 13 catalytic domain-containing protein n=1 Tax=Ganoderma sinense ZZ0214-1 TaxID=1077348 RepID=A0A2G8SPA6_9APHY|nr:hypothetical protein GSI_02332 [Ganoderma sinense ZZ0214-1]
MIPEILFNAFIRVWEYLTFWWYSPPALSNMRLKGPARDGNENELMIQFFTWEAEHPHMSWWKHFETEVPNLAEMGISQVWLPPPNKAMRKQGQGYDAYDLWDLGEFYQKGTIATRWGTKEELVHAIAAANAHGIDVLVDAVLNHKLGGDRLEKFNATPVDPNDRLRDIGPTREIEGWTGFDFNGRAGQYSSFKWTHDHFTGLDWDHRTRTKGIWRITGDKHEGWSDWVDSENGNYDYLLGIDIDPRHPDVRKDLMKWGSWILQTTGGAGFRLDAIKHMDRRFLLSFIKHVRETLGRPDLFSVAEYWSTECVFYGDLYPNEECYDPSIAKGLKRLMEARKNFAYGARTDYFMHQNCIGFVRRGDREPGTGHGHGGCAVLISNADSGLPEQQESGPPVATSAVPVHTLRMNVGSENAGATYCGHVSPGNPEEVVRIDADGWGAFTCPYGGLQVWVRASIDNGTSQ